MTICVAATVAGDKDKSDASKLRNVNPLGALGGPAVSLAADVYQTGVALPLRLISGGSANYSDITRAKNLMPFHAVPVFQQGLNPSFCAAFEHHSMLLPSQRNLSAQMLQHVERERGGLPQGDQHNGLRNMEHRTVFKNFEKFGVLAGRSRNRVA